MLLARRLRLRRRRRRRGAADQGPRLALVRRDQGRPGARPHVRRGQGRGREAMARRRGRQGARRQGRRHGQAARRRRDARRASRRAPALEVEIGRGHSSQRRRRAAPRASSAPSSPSPPDGAGSAATPDGRVVFKITADATPPTEADDPAVKASGGAAHRGRCNRASSTQYVTALERELGVTIHEHVLQARRGRLSDDDDGVQDYEDFARRYAARPRRASCDDAGRGSGDAGLGLSQARRRARRATCSCSSRSRAARSAGAIR